MSGAIVLATASTLVSTQTPPALYRSSTWAFTASSARLHPRIPDTCTEAGHEFRGEENDKNDKMDKINNDECRNLGERITARGAGAGV